MKKLLLILLCLPMIGFGQTKSFIKTIGKYELSGELTPVQSTAVFPNVSAGIWVINKTIDNAVPFISFRYSKLSIWDYDRKNKNMSFSHRQEEVNIVHMYVDGNGISNLLIIETPRGFEKCYCSHIGKTSGDLTFECHWDFVETMTEMWFGKDSRADFKLVFRDTGELYLYYSPNLWGRYKKLKCFEEKSFTLHKFKQ
jgi:hypothetical protein